MNGQTNKLGTRFTPITVILKTQPNSHKLEVGHMTITLGYCHQLRPYGCALCLPPRKIHFPSSSSWSMLFVPQSSIYLIYNELIV